MHNKLINYFFNNFFGSLNDAPILHSHYIKLDPEGRKCMYLNFKKME
jgi:hypothetical protein